MEYLAEKPKVLFPILMIFFGFSIFVLIKKDLIIEFTKNAMMRELVQKGMSIEDIPEQVLQFSTWGAVVGAMIGPFIGWFIKSVVVHVIAKITKGVGTFKASLSAVGYAYLIMLFGEGIRTIISLITQNAFVLTSPAVFLGDEQFGTPLYTIMSSLDIFSIWYLVVGSIGIAYVHKISRKKSSFIVFGSWAVAILFSLASAMMK
jgi:hypothetical protein